jgi:Respiratory-chain NADH dehydrogenase 51 Kd subunit
VSAADAPPAARLLAAPAGPELADHLSAYGPPPFSPAGSARAEHEALIAAVEEAGLTGRGGAGFPAGRKLRAVAAAGRRAGPLRSPAGTVVIANGGESEPASANDPRLPVPAR